ncbi:MAG: flagellar hook capping FlgD N-terminal domain-containing protein [Bryobacteraceae bacterium]|jgi:flagellar basal-body rod modification protein FlgD
MASGVNPLGSGSTTPPATPSASSSTSTTQDMFLQLLVAQLQNQDPTNPMDTTNMVTQLAEVQQLQETIGLGQNVSSILQDLNQLTGAGSTSSTTTGATGSGS